uniref:Uncharacterized protein n=1 Tax=Romanomermis culicivorax TaxID=13658 RepID=A0A915KG65_ROMCU
MSQQKKTLGDADTDGDLRLLRAHIISQHRRAEPRAQQICLPSMIGVVEHFSTPPGTLDEQHHEALLDSRLATQNFICAIVRMKNSAKSGPVKRSLL